MEKDLLIDQLKQRMADYQAIVTFRMLHALPPPDEAWAYRSSLGELLSRGQRVLSAEEYQVALRAVGISQGDAETCITTWRRESASRSQKRRPVRRGL